MNQVRVGPFRWMVGALCAYFGALMLVQPDQFSSPVYRAVQPHLTVWGIGFLSAGAALLCVAALAPRTAVRVGVHAVVVGMLLALAGGFAYVGVWTGATSYAVLGLGTGLAAILPLRGRGAWGRGDLLSLAVGADGLIIGLLLLLVPAQFGAPTYDAIRASLVIYGAAFVVISLGLIAVQLLPTQNQAVKRVVHLLAAGMFLLFMVKAIWPNPTGVALWAGFGLAVGLQPWLAQRLPALDPSSLRARSALMLIAVAALPLIGAVAIVADQAGRVRHTAGPGAAADPGRGAGRRRRRLHSPAPRRRLRAGFHAGPARPGRRTPSTRCCATSAPPIRMWWRSPLYDIDGSPLARSDDLPSAAVDRSRRVRRCQAPERTLHRRSHLPADPSARSSLFGAPIRDASGQFAGLVIESMESTRLAEQITQASGGKDMLAYLVDAQGRVIAHPNAELVASFADVSATPPVAAFLVGQRSERNRCTYSAPGGEQLVATRHSPISAGA